MRRTRARYELPVAEGGWVHCPRLAADTDVEVCYTCGNFAGTARRNSHQVVCCSTRQPRLFSDICDVLEEAAR